MKYLRLTMIAMVRALVLALGLTALGAQADEYSEVTKLLDQGKLMEAQARVERHLAARPRDPQMRFLKGVIQRESGRLNDAIATFTRLTEDHPDLPEPYNNLAVIHAAQGQYDKARVALEKALRTNPSYATAHDNLGDIYAKLASQAYSKALQIDGVTAPPVQVKLALLRDLSTQPGSRPAPAQAANKPATAVAVLSQPAAAKPATPAPAPVKPAPPAATPKPAPQPAVVAAKPPSPPVTAAAPAVTSSAAAGSSSAPVEQAVRAWARAWADKDMAQYLAAYGKDFQTPGNVARSAWEQDRRLRITGKARITVNLLDLQVSVNGERAVAKFRQDYKADALAVLSRKTLELVKSGDRWLIVKETSGS